MDRVSAAVAVTRGAAHSLIYANYAFRRFTPANRETVVGLPIMAAFTDRESSQLTAVLERAFRTGIAARDQRIEGGEHGRPALSCTVWPVAGANGEEAHLLVELRTTEVEEILTLQRLVSERMVLSALRERDVAKSAEESRRGAAHLAETSRRFAESLDEGTTLDAIARVSLPHLGAWCIVDVIDGGGTMRRLRVIHPDPAKQALLSELEGRWLPDPADAFGAPEMLRSAQPVAIADATDVVLAAAAHDGRTLQTLQDFGVGALLTVPLVIHERVVGAITFVTGERGYIFTEADRALASDLALRSAMALDSARLHGEALTLKKKAEAASQAKSAFLGTMSHELRTPLNAIGGYVDLLDMGLRGPVTEAQRADLARIRSNQQHLLALIVDILDLVRVGSGRVEYDIRDFVVEEALAAAVAIVESLIVRKTIVYDTIDCDPAMVACGDPAKVIQILVNMLSNAVKFTHPGGQMAMGCVAADDAIHFYVSDTGVGIPADKLEAIFDPFFQVNGGLAGRDSGVGLGLAISRDLARAMHGDLTVESELGLGSRFTLTLPGASRLLANSIVR
jgi:signal transduction histidine kinase